MRVIVGVIVGATDVELLTLGDTLAEGLTDGEIDREMLALGDDVLDSDVDGLVDGLTDVDADGVGDRDEGFDGSLVEFELGEAPVDRVAVAVGLEDGVGSGNACEHEKRTLSVFGNVPASCTLVVQGLGGVAAHDHVQTLLAPRVAVPAKQMVCNSDV